jgi:hypothetical protein
MDIQKILFKDRDLDVDIFIKKLWGLVRVNTKLSSNKYKTLAFKSIKNSLKLKEIKITEG